jgi:hypothetical protein
MIMNEADVLTEIDITERHISKESTGTPNEIENTENVLPKTEKSKDENELKSKTCSSGSDLSDMAETTICLPEFQFVHRDFSDESNGTIYTEKSELKSAESISLEGNSIELKETERENENTKIASSKTLKRKSKTFTILHEDEFSDGEKDSADISMVALLRSTICELERALRDSRTLIKTRDDDIASLRKEVEKGMLQSPARSQ